MSADLTPEDGPTPDEQAMAEDGFPSGARWMPSQMRHPSYAATRAHFAANPMPTQKNRRAA
ncbi:hypothetical protein AMK23_26135 [Streptomyces sp. CB02130]|uniref:hypothetical protein n=1 Tax=Streptomyces sp. CB02130 TaxID=1703934 RepID=UPI00093C9E57|nr:hypothetical protein [Streptomyces sp. CB02130]OKJ24321.1 hypothetical protein AMK23_26135 [Streptomyces sp. CB02130]